MNIKIVIAGVIILGGIIFGAISFVDSNIEYTNFSTASASGKKVQVKGEWMREKTSSFDPAKGQFIFTMKDESGREEKVIFDGAKPNNFEIANSIVVKGRFGKDGSFHASEILTKCPSKYEGQTQPATQM